MKKTISIHIKGINFLIEEEAYEILKNYMTRLELKLSNTTGKEDIIEDIELRIVELFSARLTSRKEVIEEKEVMETIATLGEPEQFIDEDTNDESNEKKQTNKQEYSDYSSSEKRLYRDIENASIAGVCAGLANYFKMDRILVRVLFVLFTLAAGFGVPLYIILWIVLPSATSPMDRLRMQGRPITVDSVKEEVEMAANRMSSNGQKFSQKIQRESGLQSAFRGIGRIISKIIGAFLLFLGIVFTILFVGVLIGKVDSVPLKTENGYASLYHLGSLIFEDQQQLDFIWLIASIFLLTIIIWLITSGTRLLFNIRYIWYKYLSRGMFFVVIAAFCVAIYYGAAITKEFSIEKSVETEIAISAEPFTIKTENDDYDINNYRHNGYNRRNGRNYWLLITKKGIEERGVHIYYEQSSDSLYHIILEKSASSRNDRTALKRAKNIQFEVKKNGSSYFIPNTFHFPEYDKIRNQVVRVYVQIPAGKSVKVNDDYVYPSSDYGFEEQSHSITL